LSATWLAVEVVRTIMTTAICHGPPAYASSFGSEVGLRGGEVSRDSLGVPLTLTPMELVP
jgi:hypothetical protein